MRVDDVLMGRSGCDGPALPLADHRFSQRGLHEEGALVLERVLSGEIRVDRILVEKGTDQAARFLQVRHVGRSERRQQERRHDGVGWRKQLILIDTVEDVLRFRCARAVWGDAGQEAGLQGGAAGEACGVNAQAGDRRICVNHFRSELGVLLAKSGGASFVGDAEAAERVGAVHVEQDSGGAFVTVRVDFLVHMDVDVAVGGEPILDIERIAGLRENCLGPLAANVFAPIQLHADLALRALAADVLQEGVKWKIGDHGGVAGLGGRRLRSVNEGDPEQIKPSAPPQQHHVIAGDIVRNLFPAAPGAIRVAAEEIGVGNGVGAAEDVERAVAGIAHILIEIAGDDVQARAQVEALEVIVEGILSQVLRDVALQQGAFELLEQVRFVQAEFRLEPIFGEQEYFPIGLPDAVALHPVPEISGDGASCDIPCGVGIAAFEIEEAALDEGLNRGERQTDARGLHHGLHAGIDEKILE